MKPENRFFVDTGPIVGKFHKNDPYHEISFDLFGRLDERRAWYVTSTLVMAEALTMLGYSVGHEAASTLARGLLHSTRWTIVRPEIAVDLDALEWFRKFDDQKDLSYCDCVSFAVMAKNKLRQVFSFDHHFDLADFERVFVEECP